MTLLDNEKFLSELRQLFQGIKRKDAAKSISITMKPYDGRKKPLGKDQQMEQPSLVLFKAKVGSKKISTSVKSKEVNNFHAQYFAVLSKAMDKLKQKDQPTGKEAGVKKGARSLHA